MYMYRSIHIHIHVQVCIPLIGKLQSHSRIWAVPGLRPIKRTKAQSVLTLADHHSKHILWQWEVKFWTSLSAVWNWKTPISSATAVGSPDLPTFPKSERFPWRMTWSSDLNFLDKILSTFLLQLFDPLTLSGYVNKTWNPWFQTPIW